jgi:hypothetical protein
MTDLAAFLAARLDEDEAVAKAAQEVASSDTELAQQAGPCVSDPGYAHIARHGPSRVLREVAAKRAILAEHRPERWGQSLIWCSRCYIPVPDAREDEDQYEHVDWPCPTVRALIAVYSDHSDYRGQ